MSWAGSSGGGTTAAARDDQERTSSTSVPAPVLAAGLALCTEAAELDRWRTPRGGGGCRVSVRVLSRPRAWSCRGRGDHRRRQPRGGSSRRQPAAPAPAGRCCAAAAGELAASLLTRVRRGGGGNAIAPALPTLLSGMLRQHPGGAAAVANSEWLAPVVAVRLACCAILTRRRGGPGPGPAAAGEEEEDEDVVALPKAVLAAVRLPAQQVALAGALARYTAGRIKNTAGSGGSGSGLMRGGRRRRGGGGGGGARRDGATTDVGEVKERRRCCRGSRAPVGRPSGSRGVDPREMPPPRKVTRRVRRHPGATASSASWPKTKHDNKQILLAVFFVIYGIRMGVLEPDCTVHEMRTDGFLQYIIVRCSLSLSLSLRPPPPRSFVPSFLQHRSTA